MLTLAASWDKHSTQESLRLGHEVHVPLYHWHPTWDRYCMTLSPQKEAPQLPLSPEPAYASTYVGHTCMHTSTHPYLGQERHCPTPDTHSAVQRAGTRCLYTPAMLALMQTL